jgi:tetratricopeptide (TPR) repeat protein
LPIYRAVYGNEHPQVAVLLNNIGRSQLMGNRLVEAQTTLDQALAIDRRFLPKDDDQLVPPLNSLGMIALARGDATGAQPLLEEALRIGTLKNSPILDQILGNCSATYAKLSRPDDARTALAHARSLQSKQYGDSLAGADSWRAAVLDLIEASNAHAAKDDHAALVLLNKATPTLRARFGPDGFYTHQAMTLTSLTQRNSRYGRTRN